MKLSVRTPTAAIAILAAISGLVLAGPASARSTKSPDTQNLPAVLAKAADSGQFKVIRQFKTDLPGVTGYVLERKGQHKIVYGDHGYLIMGNLISPQGKNLSAEYADKYVPKPNVAKVVGQLKSTGHLIQQGPDDAPVLYVFADPNCIFCHRFYEEVKPLAKAGKLQVQWALVSILKQSSMGRAAAILSADNPLKAMAENEAGFDNKSENGGIKPIDSPSDRLKTLINKNGQLMAAAGGSGTPTVLYRKKDGQWAKRVGLVPQKWLKRFIDNHS